ncbi:MAG: hypothetical protein IJV93_01155 [Lentisphaeria bacterium]|nr:hypothetical protein [Lentisphaeria bacterium]
MKILLRHILTAALLGVIGCTSADSEKGRFDRIAKDLDMGGSSFFIGSSRHAGTAFEQLRKQHERYVWSSSFTPEAQYKLQRFISCSELAGRLAGLHEIKGWGGSSKELPGTKERVFRNRFRLLLNEKSDGVLWNLFSPQNRALEKYLYNLPADTSYAGAFVLNPVMLERLITTEKSVSATFTNLCKLFLGMTPRETLKAFSGVWRIVVVCDEANDPETLMGIHVALTLPDKEGKLFKGLSSKLQYLPNTSIDLKKKTIKLAKLPGKACIPYIRSGNGQISFYTTPLAAVRTTDKQSFPQQPPFVASLARFTDLNGIGVFYANTPWTGSKSTSYADQKLRHTSLAVLKKLPDGFIFEGISNCDFNQYAVFSLGILPLQTAFESLSKSPAAAAGASRQTAPVLPQKKKRVVRKRTSVAAPKPSQSCLTAIQTAGGKLLKEAKRSGKWPAPGISGLRFLVNKKILTAAMLRCPAVRLSVSDTPGLSYANCHYLYFGAPDKESPKTPLLMEFPFLHPNHIAIFYADGSVKKIQLDGTRNVRRAVSYLHTLHSYEEKEFMRLMQLASEFDNILER